MALNVRVIHDPGGETLTVYFAEPRSDQVCEETGEGVILINDRQFPLSRSYRVHPASTRCVR